MAAIKSVAIIGGGVSGLVAAYRLLTDARKANRFLEVSLYESAGEVGGKMRTDTQGGYQTEWGPNGFLDNVPETLELMEELGLSSELVRASEAAQHRFITKDRKLIEVPTAPLAFLKCPLLSVPGRLRVFMEPFGPGPKKNQTDETVAQFGRRRIGKEAVEILIDPMVSGIFAGNPYELSLKSAFPKMHDMEATYGSLTRAMIAKMKARKKAGGKAVGGPSGPAGILTSLRGGMGELIHRLEEKIRALGGKINVGTSVRSIKRSLEGGFQVSGPNQGETRVDAVMVATLADVASSILQNLDEKLSQEISDIDIAPICVVALGFRGEEVSKRFDGFGFLVPRREKLRMLGCLWDSSIFPQRAPDGSMLIRVMIGGARDRNILDLDGEQLAQLARQEVEALMGQLPTPDYIRTYRHEKGIPQYNLGHSARLERIEKLRSQHPGLYLIGNSYRGISLNDCARDAQAIAREVLK